MMMMMMMMMTFSQMTPLVQLRASENISGIISSDTQGFHCNVYFEGGRYWCNFCSGRGGGWGGGMSPSSNQEKIR